MRTQDITTQLYMARAVSLVLYVCTVLIVYGMMRDLTPLGHSLRWVVPLVVALVPPFADLMTAVNSDVGAITLFSLFLWGTVRMIRYGFTLRRLGWIIITAILCAAVKDTSLVAVVLAPIGVLLAIWARSGWSWRLFTIIVGSAIVAVALALFGWGDARSWYRWYGFELQPPTRAQTAAVLGSHAVTIQAGLGQRHQLLNAMSDHDISRLAGQDVSVGGWMWAETPTTTVELGLAWSEQGSVRMDNITAPVTLTTTPTFVVYTFTVPERVGKLFYTVVAKKAIEGEQPSLVYLDGAVLVQGKYTAQVMPEFRDVDARTGVWDGQNFVNLVRNASGEAAWPRVRPWVAETLPRLVNRERLWVVAPLFDVERMLPFIWRTATEWLLYGLFGRFAWGHVTLVSILSPVLFQVLAVISLLGSTTWWFRSKPAPYVRPALAFLAIAGLVVWVSVSLWPLSYFFISRTPMPASRYTFPIIVPTVLVMVGGWWALWPRQYRFVGLWTIIIAMVLLDVISIWTIWSYYRSLV